MLPAFGTAALLIAAQLHFFFFGYGAGVAGILKAMKVNGEPSVMFRT